MKDKKRGRRVVKRSAFIGVVLVLVCVFVGCSEKSVRLNPKKPVTITVWHYYNGIMLNVFESMLKEFNEGVGVREGIIVEGNSLGSVSELEREVRSAINNEVGSMTLPNIFASYADTAYEVERMGMLANLDDYFTKKEQQEYVDSYIEEGKIGLNGELRIFPIAKSTEILMVNETDWFVFADENGLTYHDLRTVEDIARVSEIYYHWTDAKTPDIPHDGKAFFGRDAMANLFIMASKAFGVEIFQVEGDEVSINVEEEIMRRIWDYYYVPFISGYFAAYGRYRSDDMKVGDVIAYVGATSSAAYFPSEVAVNGESHSITPKILPVPNFKDGQDVLVQQGAGMAVTKATPQEEYASILFLKWFTQESNNIEFSSSSGYMPVKKSANDYDMYMQALEKKGEVLDEIVRQTLLIAVDGMKKSEMYTNKAFEGGTDARAILENHLQSKAIADRETVQAAMQNGESHSEAVRRFDTEENFQSWLEDFRSQLME